MALPLKEVFPDEDYRFHLTLRPATVGQFFRPATPAVLAERGQLLQAQPRRYAALTGAGEALLNSFAECIHANGDAGAPTVTAFDRLVRFGRELEPDFLLLDAQLDLQAGVVCFPSSWSLEEKIGRPLHEIHGPVPTLNAGLGGSINRFFERLRPGMAFERANWGLASTSDLNLHPSVARPSLDPSGAPDRIYVRIEDQIVARLPAGLAGRSTGFLFAIRLRVFPLHELLTDADLARRFRRALRTMPETVAAYKGLAAARTVLACAPS